MKYLFTLLALLLTLPVIAQDATPESTAPLPAFTGEIDAYIEVSNDAPRLGEPFDLTIVVVAPAGAEIATWATLPPDEPLTLLETSGARAEATAEATPDLTPEITPDVQPDGTHIFRQTWRVAMWQTGQYLTPELTVSVETANGAQNVLVRSAALTVPSMLDANGDATLRPAIGTIDLAYIPRWVYAAGIVVLGLVIALIARAVQSSTVSLRLMGASTPAQVAIAQLEDLDAQQLPAETTYPLVAAYLRQYLQTQYAINAAEMTTSELMQYLRDAAIFSKGQRRQLHQLLEQADLVKFARFQPPDDASRRLIRYAIQWLRRSEQITRQEERRS